MLLKYGYLIYLAAWILQFSAAQNISQQCEDLVQDFVTTCSASSAYPKIKGFQSSRRNSLALCCKEDSCCKKLDNILEQDCARKCQFSSNKAFSEAISLHHTMCQSQKLIPQCLSRVDNEAEQIVKRCEQRSLELVNVCGFIFEEQRDDISSDFSCCFPQSCCQRSQDYLTSECNNDCFDGESWAYSAIHMATSIAKIWQTACLLPPDIQQCSVQQVMSTTSSSSYNNPTQMPFEEDTQGVAISEVSTDYQQQVSSNSEPQKNSVQQECDILMDKLQPESVQGATENLKTYCAVPDDITIVSLQNLCCQLVDRMVRDACMYTFCSTNSITSYDESSLTILTNWMDSQKCSASMEQQCDIKNALASVSGGTDTAASQQQDLAQVVPQELEIEFSADAVMSLFGGADVSDEERQQAGFDLFQSFGLNKNRTQFQLLEIMPRFTKFYEQLDVLGLEQRLKGIPLTILAIDNDIMEKMFELVEGDNLTETIRNHILPGPFASSVLNPDEQVDLQTLAASSLSFKQSDGDVVVQGCCSSSNSANHVADVQTLSGMLWIVDNVIYPPTTAQNLFP